MQRREKKLSIACTSLKNQNAVPSAENSVFNLHFNNWQCPKINNESVLLKCSNKWNLMLNM